MKLVIYLICIFMAMIKTADASEINTQMAINNIVIKPNQIIHDRAKFFTYEDIVLEYSLLCQEELQSAKNTLSFQKIKAICKVTFENLKQLKTPEKIALYEAKLKNKKAKFDMPYDGHYIAPIESNSCENKKLCKALRLTSSMADYTLRLIFYPLKVIMTGDIKI